MEGKRSKWQNGTFEEGVFTGKQLGLLARGKVGESTGSGGCLLGGRLKNDGSGGV